MAIASAPTGAGVNVEPIVSYPRLAEPGRSYLLTVDLRPAHGDGDWPLEVEELAVSCAARSEPSDLFAIRPLDRPAVVVHRFGGSYGPASFVLTAADQVMTGRLVVTMSNGWGIPFVELSLPGIEVRAGTGARPAPDQLELVPEAPPAAASQETSEVAPAPPALPRNVDLRPLGPPVYNQGQSGSVVAQVTAAAIQFDQVRQGVAEPFMPSRLFIYYNVRRRQGATRYDTGGTISAAMQTIAEEGVCPEDLWPYDLTRFDRRPPARCYRAASEHRIAGARRIARSLDALKLCLAGGVPFAFGIVVHQSFMGPETASTGRVTLPARGENVIGGHALVAVGYDEEQQTFLVRNSWGAEWGAEGYCFVPYAYLLDPNLSSDFWAINPPDGVPTVEEPEQTATPEAQETSEETEVEEEPDADAEAARLGSARWAVYDAGGRQEVRGRLVRREGESPTEDLAEDEASAGLEAVLAMLRDAFGRTSYDDQGGRLEAVVHYGRGYNNAYWDGQRMVFGDGDGRLFNRFTIAPEMFGHAVGHAIIQHTARLEYQGQSGALNESICDVFGTLVRQWVLRQTAEQADWLIGVGLLARGVKGTALRSLRAPGTAYDDPTLGRDRQPGHMRNFVTTNDDNGGVHTNCGIPNRAFYLAASAIGGYAWERAGQIWYVTLRDKLTPQADFALAARATIGTAGELFGRDSPERRAVEAAWIEVGVLERPVSPPAEPRPLEVEQRARALYDAGYRNRYDWNEPGGQWHIYGPNETHLGVVHPEIGPDATVLSSMGLPLGEWNNPNDFSRSVLEQLGYLAEGL